MTDWDQMSPDVTAPARATDDPTRASSFMAAVLAGLEDAVVACDAGGHLTVMNDSAQLWHGQGPRPDLESTAWPSSYHLCLPDGSTLAADQVPLARALRGELVRDEPLLIRVPGQPDREVRCTGHQLHERGLLRGAVVSMHDVTEREAARRRETRRVAGLLATIEVQRELAAAATDHQAVLDVVARHAVRAFPGADGSVVELVDGDDRLSYQAAAGVLAGKIGMSVSRRGSLSGAVLALGEVTRCDDTETDPRVDLAACRATAIRSMIVAPLLTGTTGLGVLKVSASRPHAFDASDEQTIELLVRSLVAGLQHADDVLALEERNERLAEADRLKVDLLGLLGHEIQTPLASIRGYTEMALDDPSTTQVARTLEVVDRSALRIEAIVREVLALVALDAGRLQARPEDVLLLPRLAAVVASGTIPDLSVVCDPALRVLVQPGHLDLVLTNLVSNAGKYGGGSARIEATAVPAGDGVPAHVQVLVSDDGPGVPDGFVDELFERFQRAASTAGSVSGTGLGLYIARALALANGGDLTYRRGPAGGAEFVVELGVPGA